MATDACDENAAKNPLVGRTASSNITMPVSRVKLRDVGVTHPLDFSEPIVLDGGSDNDHDKTSISSSAYETRQTARKYSTPSTDVSASLEPRVWTQLLLREAFAKTPPKTNVTKITKRKAQMSKSTQLTVLPMRGQKRLELWVDRYGSREEKEKTERRKDRTRRRRFGERAEQ